MYAIVKIGGHQYKVEKDQEVFVNRLAQKAGDKILLDKVLLIDNNGKVITGAPTIEGAGVTATVVEHVKADKVLVFRKKRRKGYRKLNGHRQAVSKIKIDKIEDKGAKAPVNKAAAKEKEIPAEPGTPAPKASASKAPAAETKAEDKPAKAAKKEAAPKAEAKKEPKAATKKSTVKKKEDEGQ